MERKINKEIREYRDAMFWGLTLRQFLFSISGLGISVGIYFLLRARLDMEAASWACIFEMLPCAMLGFISYNKMPAEKFLWAVIIKLQEACRRRFPSAPFMMTDCFGWAAHAVVLYA